MSASRKLKRQRRKQSKAVIIAYVKEKQRREQQLEMEKLGLRPNGVVYNMGEIWQAATCLS